LRDQRIRIRHRPVLEHGMQQGMNRIGIVAAHRKRALGHGAPSADLAVLGHRPAVVRKKPPVVAIVGRVAFAQILPRLVVVRLPGKREQPERAERQRHYGSIAWPGFEVLECGGQRRGGLAFNRECQSFDMALFPRGAAAPDQVARRRGPLPCGVTLLVEGMETGAPDMRQREVGIECDRALQVLGRAGPGRQHQVDTSAISLGRLG
jgi:hypothetical protein